MIITPVGKKLLVSPVSKEHHTTESGIIAVENILNNLPLANSGFIVTNGGSGYANSGDVTVTISPCATVVITPLNKV
jgi:co-chaperonin GroES (HSP10)